MIAFLSLLIKILPLLTSLLTLIGGVNAVQAGSVVVTYGASPSSSSILMAVVPLLLAGMTKLGTVLGKARLEELMKLGAKQIGLSDASAGYAIDFVDVGRIAVYAKLYAEAGTDDERAKIAASADVAFGELRARLFPEKGGA